MIHDWNENHPNLLGGSENEGKYFGENFDPK